MTFTPELAKSLAMCGGFAAVALAAIGSAIGAGHAGVAAVAAWKRCYAQNKPAPFMLVGLAGAPLSQTIYGFIMMILIQSGVAELAPEALNYSLFYLVMGFLTGFGMLFSAAYQGNVAAAACDSFGETGKGLTNYLLVIGIVETVALFVLVFGLIAIGA